MKAHRLRNLIALGFLSVSATTAFPQPASFSDGFEGSTLDPFWVPSTFAGGILTFPSTAQAHGGSQSVELSVPESMGQDSFASLSHVFAGGAYGALSLWFYDRGESTAAHFDFSIDNGANTAAGLYAPEGSGNFYSFLFNSGGLASGVPRSQGWHHLSINSVPGLLDLAVDGATNRSAGGFAFTEIRMRWYSDGGFPGGTVHIDDFAFTPVPEPATWRLLGIGASALWIFKRNRRNAAS
jgi:hypothetical protein